MNITLRSSIGSGTVNQVPVADGTTLAQFVRTTQGSGRFRVTVRSAGDSDFTTRSDGYNLREGDTVSVTPADVKGAGKTVKGPAKKAVVKKANAKKPVAKKSK